MAQVGGGATEGDSLAYSSEPKEPREKFILPSTFSKLYHMRTINAPDMWRVSCPEDMANLVNLRHISAWLHFPNVGSLTSLQTRWQLQWYGKKPSAAEQGQAS